MASNETETSRALETSARDAEPATMEPPQSGEGRNVLLRLPVQGIVNSLSTLGNVSRFVGSRVRVSISPAEPRLGSLGPGSWQDNGGGQEEAALAAGATAGGGLYRSNGEELDHDSNHVVDTALPDLEAGMDDRQIALGGEDEGGLAADAERVRLTTPNQSTTLDIRNVAKVAEATLPYLIIALTIFVYHHLRAVFLLGAGTWVLHRCNRLFKSQVALRSDIQRKKILISSIALIFTGFFIAMVGFHGKLLGPFLIFGSAPYKQFWLVAFTIMLQDLYIRLFLATGKALMIIVAKVDSQENLRRRTGLLSAMDYGFGGLRVMFPIPLWLQYLFGADLPWVLSILLAVLYLIFKLANVYQSWQLAGHAIRSWLRVTLHGWYPTKEELDSISPDCPICQDRLRTPLKLTCGHVFCEDCVEEWLARESTCPMCRATVQQPVYKPRGDGATALLPVIC